MGVPSETSRIILLEFIEKFSFELLEECGGSAERFSDETSAGILSGELLEKFLVNSKHNFPVALQENFLVILLETLRVELLEESLVKIQIKRHCLGNLALICTCKSFFV